MSGVFVLARDRTSTYWKKLTDTSTTKVYENEGQQGAKGVVMHIVNESGGTVTAFVYYYDAVPWDGSVATEVCIGAFSIEDDKCSHFDLMGLRLDVGDELRVKAANGFSVTVTVTEFQGSGG